MAQVAFHQSTFAQSIASGHTQIRRWNSPTCNQWNEQGACIGWSSGYYSYSTTNARINGFVKASVNNVYVNGKKIARVEDQTQETESHSPPSGWSLYNAHYTGTGKVSTGSSKVFASGRAITMVGKQVKTHANTTTTINSGSSNVHAN